MREIVFDTETTGIMPGEGHRIVEIGAVELVNRVMTGRTYQTYLDPCRPMPKDAQNVHGLSSDFLTGQPVFEMVIDDFLAFIGDAPLVAHNAAFDMEFLNWELKRAKRTPLPMSRWRRRARVFRIARSPSIWSGPKLPTFRPWTRWACGLGWAAMARRRTTIPT